MTEETGSIECSGVWKVYGSRAEAMIRRSSSDDFPTQEELEATGCIAAVCNVSLSVRSGEILVIMGLSGSGKSTLLRCLCRLVEPTRGRVLIDGENILDASSQRLIELRRRKLGMVFQHFGLLPHRTVIGNVVLPLELQGIDRAARNRQAQTMIDLVGLQGRENYYPSELSGGQQQRVGIARSLAADPEIWLLDEPFSSLDPLIRTEMQDEFLRLQQQLDKTICFVTHDFDEAVRLADRIAIMRDGQIVQIATPEELVLHPVDEYVERFSRSAAHSKLVTARRVVDTTAETGGDFSISVPAEAKVAEIASTVLATAAPVGVMDNDGSILGAADKAKVLELLTDVPAARR